MKIPGPSTPSLALNVSGGASPPLAAVKFTVAAVVASTETNPLGARSHSLTSGVAGNGGIDPSKYESASVTAVASAVIVEPDARGILVSSGTSTTVRGLKFGNTTSPDGG